jgi:hypothetical protein
MKKITLISAIALSGLFYSTANAQILQIGLHLGGGRPVVQTSVISPNVAVSYTNADNYYYLPDVDAYYNTYEQAYYYNDGERWVSAAYLPGEYRNYDWRNARHYELRARRPYLNDDVYRERYRGNADWNRNNDRVDNRSYANRDERRNEEHVLKDIAIITAAQNMPITVAGIMEIEGMITVEEVTITNPSQAAVKVVMANKAAGKVDTNKSNVNKANHHNKVVDNGNTNKRNHHVNTEMVSNKGMATLMSILPITTHKMVMTGLDFNDNSLYHI